MIFFKKIFIFGRKTIDLQERTVTNCLGARISLINLAGLKINVNLSSNLSMEALNCY